MIYAKEYLENHGFEHTGNSENADFVLLPVPVKERICLKALRIKFCFYGMGNRKTAFDYMKYESFVLKMPF